MLKTAMILFKNKKLNRINDYINTFLDQIENNDNEVHVLNSSFDINHNLISYNKIIFIFDFGLIIGSKYKKLIQNYIKKQELVETKEIYAVVLKYNFFDSIILKKITKYFKKNGIIIRNAYLFDLNKQRFNIRNKELALI